MSEIFAMDGYGFYVWGSVLISVVVLFVNWMTAHKLFKSISLRANSAVLLAL